MSTRSGQLRRASSALRLVALATRPPAAYPGGPLASKLAAQRARCVAAILRARGLVG